MKYRTPLAMAAMLAISAPAAAATHVASVDHSSGTVEARYQGAVKVQHKQVGAFGPGGRASTAKCVWTAHLAVDRTASTVSGARVSRSFTQDSVAEVTRPGWCRAGSEAVQQQLIAQLGDLEPHVQRAAQDDHATLLAELDQHSASQTAGG